MAQVTRLSLMGVAMRPYGSFAGKAEAVAAHDLHYLITEAELEQLFQDTEGVVVTFGAYSTYGHFEEEDETVIQGPAGLEVIGGAKTLVVPTGTLVGLDIGDTVTAAGLDFTVQKMMEIRGGAETAIQLSGDDEVPVYDLLTQTELEDILQATDGVTVVSGEQSTYGHFAEESEELLGAPAGMDVIGTGIWLVVATEKLTGLDIGDSITADGVSYLIRDLRRLRGGAETAIELGRS